jgi:plastocyanin
MKHSGWVLLAALLAGCTPGAATLPAGSSGPISGKTVTIHVNLTLYQTQTNTSAGTSAGYSPAITNVNVGDAIRFMNTDGTGINHTATLIAGATTFPASSPFTASAQTQSGTMISQSWSSGILQPGSSSQTIAINQPGTYIFGCFYHYGSPMRAQIIAQ